MLLLPDPFGPAKIVSESTLIRCLAKLADYFVVAVTGSAGDVANFEPPPIGHLLDVDFMV